DECQSAEFPYYEEVGDRRLALRRKHGHISAHARTRHHHRDGTDRTGIRAEAVADALIAVNNDCLASKHGEYVAFWTHSRAGRTTNAVVVINVRVLGFGTFGEQLALFRRRPSQLVSFLETREVLAQEKQRQSNCNDKSYQCINTALTTLPPQAHPEAHRDMNQCKQGEGVAERLVDHVPQVKHLLGLLEEKDSFCKSRVLTSRHDRLLELTISGAEKAAQRAHLGSETKR